MKTRNWSSTKKRLWVSIQNFPSKLLFFIPTYKLKKKKNNQPWNLKLTELLWHQFNSPLLQENTHPPYPPPIHPGQRHLVKPPGTLNVTALARGSIRHLWRQRGLRYPFASASSRGDVKSIRVGVTSAFRRLLLRRWRRKVNGRCVTMLVAQSVLVEPLWCFCMAPSEFPNTIKPKTEIGGTYAVKIHHFNRFCEVPGGPSARPSLSLQEPHRVAETFLAQ